MKIAIRGYRETKVVDQNEIVYCQADGRYIHIFLNDNSSIMTSRLLKTIEALLSKSDFCRIHYSYLINVNYVTSIIDNTTLILNHTIRLPIAKRRITALKKILYNENIVAL